MASSQQRAVKQSQSEQEENLIIPVKLDEAQKAILDLKNTIDEEACTLQKERSTFEVMRKKLDNVHFKKHIRLNVGGQIFKTSLETVKKDPDSMLASMFSERFDVQPDEEDGAYFIDRDGTHFRFILNYLRTGRLIFPKENCILAEELYLETEFYQIRGMQNEIWPGPTFQNSSNIINSLSDDQKDVLLSWIPTPNLYNWVQLSSTQTHSWYSSNFHLQCDNKGPTVILAKAGNYIFGGYADVSWNSSGLFVKDENSFLFTLANPTGAPPTKLPQLGDAGGIWCHPSYGPAFGSATGNTITFMNTTNSSYCTVNNGYGEFECPVGQTFVSFIHGSTSSVMSSLEVFGLKSVF